MKLFGKVLGHFLWPFKLLIMLACIFYVTKEMQGLNLFVPMRFERQDVQNVKLMKILNIAGVKNPEKYKNAIEMASRETDFPEELLVALIQSESDFNSYAISPKNYKGLMQTPKASFEYPEVDILYGAKILRDKMKITHGDLLKALSLYKGGDNPLARKYALYVLNLYSKFKSI